MTKDSKQGERLMKKRIKNELLACRNILTNAPNNSVAIASIDRKMVALRQNAR